MRAEIRPAPEYLPRNRPVCAWVRKQDLLAYPTDGLSDFTWTTLRPDGTPVGLISNVSTHIESLRDFFVESRMLSEPSTQDRFCLSKYCRILCCSKQFCSKRYFFFFGLVPITNGGILFPLADDSINTSRRRSCVSRFFALITHQIDCFLAEGGSP